MANKTPPGRYTSFVPAPYPPPLSSSSSPSSFPWPASASASGVPRYRRHHSRIVARALESILQMNSAHEEAGGGIDEEPPSSSASSVGGVESLSSQVGGHPGILSSADDALIIKPVAGDKREKEFYEELARSFQGDAETVDDEDEDEDVDVSDNDDDIMEPEPEPGRSSAPISAMMQVTPPFRGEITPSPFERLRRWIPRFFGTLKLEGRVDPSPHGNLLSVTDIPEGPTDEYFFVPANIFLSPSLLSSPGWINHS